MSNEFISLSPKDTENIAIKIAEKLKGNEIIAFYGDLGAGKTCFTKGLCKALDVKDDVLSPTFALMNEYTGKYKIYHFDMYRIKNFEDLYLTGFFDYINNGIVIIEWTENIENFLSKDVIKISISKEENDNERIINIKGVNLL